MTIDEYLEFKEAVKRHYEYRKQYPSATERILAVLHDFVTLMKEIYKHAGVIKERKQ